MKHCSEISYIGASRFENISYWLISKQPMPNHILLYQNMSVWLAFELVNLRFSIEFRLKVWKSKTNYVAGITVSRDNVIVTMVYINHTKGNLAEMYVSERWILRWVFNKKNDGFYLLWKIFKECIKQNIIMAVLTK